MSPLISPVRRALTTPPPGSITGLPSETLGVPLSRDGASSGAPAGTDSPVGAPPGTSLLLVDLRRPFRRVTTTDSDNTFRSAAVFRAELRRFLRRTENCARPHGLTPNRYGLLLQIAGSESATATVSRLVERLALTQSTVTELVQRAEEAGLVQRTPSSVDGRVFDLRLTPEGARRLAKVHRALGPERERLHELLETRPPD